MFLALAYFGTDQSQVQRYLTGKSIAQSRLSLLFNAVAKIPMQFFILFTGAMVFVFFTFVKPPLLFDRRHLQRIQDRAISPDSRAVYDAAFESAERRSARCSRRCERRRVRRPIPGRTEGTRRGAQGRREANRHRGLQRRQLHLPDLRHPLPARRYGRADRGGHLRRGHDVDLGRDQLARHGQRGGHLQTPFSRPGATDHHYLTASRLATVFWGIYAVSTAQFGANLGSLIEAVNLLGSLFYGGMLGVFVLAFFFPRVNARAAFFGVLAGEAAIFSAGSPPSRSSGST